MMPAEIQRPKRVLVRSLPVIALVGVLGWFTTGSIHLDVAPLARWSVAGEVGLLADQPRFALARIDSVVDGLPAPEWRLELPDRAKPTTLLLEFPWLAPDEVRLHLSSPRPNLDFKATRIDADGGERFLSGGVIPLDTGNPIETTSEISGLRQPAALRVELPPGAVTLSAVSAPRYVGGWIALPFAVSLLALPWLMGMVTLAGFLQAGRLARRTLERLRGAALWGTLDGVRADAFDFTLGLTLAALVGLGWVAGGRPASAGGVFVVITWGAGLLELGRRWSWRASSDRAAAASRTALAVIGWSSLLTISFAVADSVALKMARTTPLDFHLADTVGRYLGAGVPVPDELFHRPWLLGLASAPWSAALGRFADPLWLGWMGAFNATVVWPAWLIAERFGADPRRTVRWLTLLPVGSLFFFLGQRGLTAALALLAATEVLGNPRDSATSIRAGLLASLGYLIHPSALFAIPGLMLLSWFTQVDDPGRRTRRTTLALLLVAGLIGPLCWSVTTRGLRPGLVNPLWLYPVMTRLDNPPDTSRGLIAALRSIPPETWRELVLNRLGHPRHYLLADNLSGDRIGWSRWISLPNAFGILLAGMLLSPGTWRGRGGLALALAGVPLLLQHLHLGQSNPQFHIGPTPWFLLGILIAMRLAGRAGAAPSGDRPEGASFARTVNPVRGAALALVALGLIEVNLRFAQPALLMAFDPASRGDAGLIRLALFGEALDWRILLASAAPLIYAAFAWRSIRAA